MFDLVFVVRQSPDWGRLATAFEAGQTIDARDYRPGHAIPGFPRRIEALIGRWNRLFGLNFFRCRQIIKDIALATVQAIPAARIVRETEYLCRQKETSAAHSLMFYMDDDDLFAPDMRERLAGLDFGQIDIAVFPLVRLGQASTTFVRAGQAATTIIGERKDFDFRFQTNNYAIITKNVSPGHVPHLKDHVIASGYADRHGLRDAYFDRILSATNKTPCSASGLPALLRDAGQAIDNVERYVQALRNIVIPAPASWLHDSIAQTADLFERLSRSARPHVRLGWGDWLKQKLG